MKHPREGSVVKWIAIALGAILLIAGGVLFWMHRKITWQAAAPLDIPALSPEVTTSLDRRVSKVTPTLPSPIAPDSPAAAGFPTETLTLMPEELTLLVQRLLPPVDGMRLAIGISGGVAEIRMSLPSKELTRNAGAQLGSMKSYIDSNIAWVNVHARAGIRYTAGKLTVSVKEVKQPSYLAADKLQALLDRALSAAPAGAPLITRAGELTVQILDLDLDADVAIVKVVRLP